MTLLNSRTAAVALALAAATQLTTGDCERIVSAAARADRIVMVGFNRRFSPHAQRARALLQQIREPRTVVYRVNAGALPPDHWLRDPLTPIQPPSALLPSIGEDPTPTTP